MSLFHILSAIALLCSVAYLAALVGKVASDGSAFPDIVLARGVTSTIFFRLSTVCYRILAEPSVATDPALSHALLVHSYLAGGPRIAMPLALPIGICAFATLRRRASLPLWTGWLGLATMVTGPVRRAIFSVLRAMDPRSSAFSSSAERCRSSGS